MAAERDDRLGKRLTAVLVQSTIVGDGVDVGERCVVDACCQSAQSAIPRPLAAAGENGVIIRLWPLGYRPIAAPRLSSTLTAVVGVDVAEVVHLEERLGGDLPVARHDPLRLPIHSREVLALERFELVERPVRSHSRSGGAARSRLTKTKPSPRVAARSGRGTARRGRGRRSRARPGPTQRARRRPRRSTSGTGSAGGAPSHARRARQARHGAGRCCRSSGSRRRCRERSGRHAEVVEGHVVAGAATSSVRPAITHLGPQCSCSRSSNRHPCSGRWGCRGTREPGRGGAGELRGHLGLQPLLQCVVHGPSFRGSWYVPMTTRSAGMPRSSRRVLDRASEGSKSPARPMEPRIAERS